MRFLLILLVAVSALACQGPEKAEIGNTEDRAVPVGTVRLAVSDFTEYGEYYGRVSGIAEATLITVAGGPVESIAVETGDAVRIASNGFRIRIKIKSFLSIMVATQTMRSRRHTQGRRVPRLSGYDATSRAPSSNPAFQEPRQAMGISIAYP